MGRRGWGGRDCLLTLPLISLVEDGVDSCPVRGGGAKR